MNTPQAPDNTLDPQAIIDGARAAIEAYRKVMADAGLTPESCVEALRRAEGDAAVEKARRGAAERMRAHDERVRTEIRHASPGKPISRTVARRLAV